MNVPLDIFNLQSVSNRQLRDFNFTFTKFLFSAKLSGLVITLEQTRFTT